MPKLIITASIDVPEDAMGQADALGRMKGELDEFKAAVLAEGGAFESRIVRPKPAKAARVAEAADAP